MTGQENTVKSRTAASYRTMIHHYRFPVGGGSMLRSFKLKKEGLEFNPRGGQTVCTIWDGETLVALGSALCSPKDNYSKTIGRNIAVGRAMKRLRNV